MTNKGENNKQLATEAVTELGLGLGIRVALSLVVGLAAWKVLEWFPSIPSRWSGAIALGIGVFGAGLIAYQLKASTSSRWF